MNDNDENQTNMSYSYTFLNFNLVAQGEKACFHFNIQLSTYLIYAKFQTIKSDLKRIIPKLGLTSKYGVLVQHS